MTWNPTASKRGADGADQMLRVDRTDGIATVTIDRAGKANALNLAVFRELNELLAAVIDDDAVRAIVITGAGPRAFSAGADIAELDGLGGAAAYEFSATGQFVFEQLESAPMPVVAAINGVAFGGGLELALACDIRVCGASARFAAPEITLANTPGWGVTQRLWHTVGVGRAKAMMLSGAPIDAATALDYGLVTEVVADDALMGRAQQLAHDLGSRSLTAVHAIKEAVRVGIAGGMDAGLRAERMGVAACCGTPEQVAAVRGFLKRHG
jgi:enoyl-CoA hydratase/carnithine racemase